MRLIRGIVALVPLDARVPIPFLLNIYRAIENKKNRDCHD
jgi:hypothetical protein